MFILTPDNQFSLVPYSSLLVLGRCLRCCAPLWLWILPTIQKQSEWSPPGSSHAQKSVGSKGIEFLKIYIEEEQGQQQEEKEKEKKEGVEEENI